jgi:hypothetical protein
MTVAAAIERWIDPGAQDPAFGELLLAQLARTTRFRDEETAAHMQRMSESCAAIARRLSFSEADCEWLRAAAQVHDVGKLGIPDAVLRKPGPLTTEERRVMQRHTEYGHEILTGSGNELVELAATIALTHHERADGTGYPRALGGEQIPPPRPHSRRGRRVRRAHEREGVQAGVHLRAGRRDHAGRPWHAVRPHGARRFLDVRAEIVEIGRRLPDEPAARSSRVVLTPSA